ncbi:MAG: F0F1 ATP synthase subunit B [Oscillospiraceae bacterium]|nr:F0F1 ATP synthase subunit B [Oscillospiraceae bacterium]
MDKVLYTDFLTIDVGTILFTLINTLLIFLAFRFILFKRVDAIVEKRKSEVDATYTEADQALSSANADKEQYAAAMAGAKQEAAEILSRAEKKAQREGDAILAEARQEALAARERASAETEREKAQARTELQGEIADLAMELAQKIMEKEINKADHERLIDDFIEEIGNEGDNA